MEDELLFHVFTVLPRNINLLIKANLVFEKAFPVMFDAGG